MNSSFFWTNSKTLKLISLYAQNDILHNPKHRDYKKRFPRETKLKEMADLIGCTPCEAKDKIQNLRTYFIKEFKRVEDSKLSGDFYSPRWEYYNELTFLKTADHSDDSCYILDDHQISNFPIIGEITTKVEPELQLEEESGPSSFEPEDTEMSARFSPACKRQATDMNRVYVPRETRLETSRSSFPEHARCFVPEQSRFLQPEPTRPTHKEGASVQDEEYFFAMQIACKLRNMPVKMRDLLKIKILNLVFETEHGSSDSDMFNGM